MDPKQTSGAREPKRKGRTLTAPPERPPARRVTSNSDDGAPPHRDRPAAGATRPRQADLDHTLTRDDEHRDRQAARAPSFDDVHELPILDPDRYELLGVHGRGGIGRVLRVRDKQLDRIVALKELIIPHGTAADRFMREALLTARLEHPGIVPIHEAGHWPDGTPYYTMKLVSGRTLKARINECTTLGERLTLLPDVIAVAEAIAYAHDNGVIHRDLKPANVLVGQYGETVVIDWGLAKDLHTDPIPTDAAPYRSPAENGVTVLGDVVGTPAYMPPEQARGERVNQQADIYSLGALLYHVVGGRRPYDELPSVAPATVLTALRQHPPTDVTDLVTEPLPRDLVAIIRRAMAREPTRRYFRASEFAKDLKRYQTGQLVGAYAYSRVDILVRWLKRYRGYVLLAVLALLVVAASTTYALIQTRHERDEARKQRQLALRERNQLALSTAENALLSNPERAMAHLASYRGTDAARVRDIVADAEARGISTLLTREQAPIISLLFFDNETLAYQAGDTTTLLGSGDTQSFQHKPALRGLLLSPSGRRALQLLTEGAAPVLDFKKGTVTSLPHQGTVWDARFTSPGRVLTTTGDGYLREWEVDTGTLHRKVQVDGEILRLDIHPEKPLVATCDASQRLHFRSLFNLKETHDSGPCIVEPTTGSGAEFSQDGRFYATATRKGVSLWSMDTLEPRHLQGPNDRITEVQFSRAGTLVAASSIDGAAYIWQTHTGDLVSMVRHGAPVLRATWAHDSDLLATGDATGSIIVTDLASGRTVDLRGHQTSIRTIAFSPDDTLLASGDRSGELRRWQLGTAETSELAGLDGPAIEFGWSSNGRFVAAATTDSTIRVWDLSAGDPRVRTLPSAFINSKIVFLPDERLAFIDEKQHVQVWDLEEPESMIPSAMPEQAVALARTESDDLVVADDSGRILLWSSNGHTISLGDLEEPIVDLRVLTGGLLAMLTTSGRVLVTHAQASSDIQEIGTHADANTILTPRTGTALFTATKREIRVWNLETGEGQTVYRSTSDMLVPTVTLTGDIVAFGNGSTIHIIDWKTGRQRLVRGYSGTVTALDFSPHERFLAGSFSDGAVRVLDLQSDGLAVHREHARPVYHLGFSPTGEQLLSGGYDHSLRLWAMEHATFRPPTTDVVGIYQPSRTTPTRAPSHAKD